MNYIEITTTFEDKQEAKRMANLLLSKNLIACCQIGEIESLYHWKGNLENTKEFIVTMKTREELYKKVETEIKNNHSYELPQIVALPIKTGLKSYLDWIDENTNIIDYYQKKVRVN